ncbi:carbonic anhydrase [Intestinirhabdus alba]|uniref:Carbonic anhydrase n=1 Tax=Intestinirhabdus alba TaxID=2899544 RepID=A0A6L6IFR7_9ENTR|nr:carbonic anhydrase family protein [Intestinirhabdus alba]MTH45621.1 carbonic anhydrase [Intestinirhabdus alba]
MKICPSAITLAALCLTSLSASAAPAHWSYQGDGAPERWGEISEAFKVCQTGMSQSPVDIRQQFVREERLPPLEIRYVDSPAIFLNNGHTLQAAPDGGGVNSIQLDGYAYTLEQFHFHAPSENTVNGQHYAMEMHLVHKSLTGKLAVVAVMFEPGSPNKALEHLWKTIPATGNSVSLSSPVKINQLLPKNRAYWRFSGSLTTPPCSEKVAWIVMKSPLTLSAEQLRKFKTAMRHDNNRPTQPLNGRTIVE